MKREIYGTLTVILLLLFVLSCGTSRRAIKGERVKPPASSTISREKGVKEQPETEVQHPEEQEVEPAADPQPETLLEVEPAVDPTQHVGVEAQPEKLSTPEEVASVSETELRTEIFPLPEILHPEEQEMEPAVDPQPETLLEVEPAVDPTQHVGVEAQPEKLSTSEISLKTEEQLKAEDLYPEYEQEIDLISQMEEQKPHVAELEPKIAKQEGLQAGDLEHQLSEQHPADPESIQSAEPERTISEGVEEQKKELATKEDVEKKDTTRKKGVKTETEDNKKIVNIDADLMRPIKLADGTKAVNLLGNVVIYHNGAVITCDSAVRYSPTRMDCFRRVVINKETTFVYGDRAFYNGDADMVRVYAPIIKMVDQDATLYTYYLSFNTLDNIVEFRNGGTMHKGANEMEAQRGFYYLDQRDFIGVDQVELKDDQYSLKSDSVIYNLDTETAQFFTKTHIWSDKRDILIADKGSYNRMTGIYNFTENSYILTEKQEIWSEAIDYDSRTESAKLYRNIQIREQEKNITAFGDYGEYWGEREEAMLTLDPSVMSYDPEEPDTLYMRSDSMFLFSHDYQEDIDWRGGRGGKRDYDQAMLGEELTEEPSTPSLAMNGEEAGVLGNLPSELSEGAHIEPIGEALLNGVEPADSVVVSPAEELVNEAEMSPEELKEYHKERDRVAKQQIRGAKQKAAETKLKEQELAREAKLKTKELAHEAKRRAKELARAAKRAKKKGIPFVVDSLPQAMDSLAMDSLSVGEIGDSVAIYKQIGVDDVGEPVYDSTVIEHYIPSSIKSAELLNEGEQKMVELDEEGNPRAGLELEESEEPQDSLQRVIKAFRDVRVYRKDFQVVCDSLVGFSKDSTLHLYIDPILWANENQIKADTIDLFTKNQEIDKAEFYGSPFMSSEVDPDRKYNQVKGRYMEAWFRKNEIYKHDVMGNGETLYYMQDEDTGDYMGLLSAECADITFLIDGQKMDRIIYRVNPVFFIYPMEQIPADQPEFLENFKWEDERRPKSKDEIMTRDVRPTQREEIESLPEPLFPLTDSILKDRDEKIKNGVWRERNDQLSPRALEFIHYLTTL